MFRTQISPGFPHTTPQKTDLKEVTGIGKRKKNRGMKKPEVLKTKKKKIILTMITGCIFHTVRKRLNYIIINPLSR